jgi:Asp-tRNA(Asn)/Glu-tRNA(Gln) amidotransferase A subunit family amidase
MKSKVNGAGGTRRDWLKLAGATGVAGAGAAIAGAQQDQGGQSVVDAVGVPPPDSEAAGISAADVARAEKLFDVQYTDAEREQILVEIDGWIDRMSRLRRVEKPNALAPACVFDPRLPDAKYLVDGADGEWIPVYGSPPPIPADPDAIAFAPISHQRGWIRNADLSCRELADIYLDRIDRHGDQLECFVTVTPEIARREADDRDAELRAGRDRGPLHGIPYGMKDIIDVAGVPATWGATPYRDRVAETDAVATTRLREAGAVLLGKTTNGALAYGDRWFDGVTRNPWNPEEGSSGSSAGSASATAAGLVGFSIGTETLGSIVSPSNRCGTTGLRPTFGRVPRNGAMALCWSLDKIGPICRHVDDTLVILQALNGADAGDASSFDAPLGPSVATEVAGLRVGYRPDWFENATDADRATLQAARDAGVELVEIELPDLPYDALFAAVEAEAAAAFEHLTLSNEDDSLVWQDPPAWPNTFRRARFISAVDLINVDRLRRHVMRVMHDVFEEVDLIIGPNFANALLVITNFTGHPQLAIKSGFNQSPSRTIFGGAQGEERVLHRVPQTTSLWAPLFQEGRLIALGSEIELRLGVAGEHPPLFS